jgi:hypothetical protein
MTNVHALHPTEEQLVQLLDNELPYWKRITVQWHLKACWECQRQLDELRSSVFEYLRFEQKLAVLELQGNQGAWRDLRRRMEQIEREAESASLFQHPPGRAGFLHAGWLIRSTVGMGVLASLFAAYVLMNNRSHVPVVPAPAKAETSLSRKAPELTARSKELLPSGHAKQANSVEQPRNDSTVLPEVAALAALHRLNADLGEPIKISVASDGRVAIVTKGLGRERETELESELAGIPAVTLHFEQPSAGASGPGGIHHSLSFAAGRIPFENDLSRLAGGNIEIRGLANEALDESDGMIARAYALHNLALQFPPDRRRELTRSEDRVVNQIESDHRQALRLHVRRLRDTLAPVFQGLAAARNSSELVSGAGLFESAQRLDHALMVVFGGADTTMSFEQAASELSAAWKQLDFTLEHVQ